MTFEKCKNRGINCGIWQGRFQCIHNGHYYVYDTTLKEFDEQMIAIVNPNPDFPADSSFVRFGSTTNPLNYFQRMLLWKKIIIDDNRQVSIVPCWHARKSVNLEREFLPVHTRQNPKRCWIVPLYQDDNEIQKSNDLEALGEVVCEANWAEESLQNRAISASYVRHTLDNDDNTSFEELVPKSIATLTKKLYLGNDPYEYRIVPLIGDSIDFSSLQKAFDWAREYNERWIVIAVAVSVSNNDDGWWFESARPINDLTFYQKMKEMEAAFHDICFPRFLITPIFIQHNSFRRLWEYSTAFLPNPAVSKWIINSDCAYNFGLASLDVNFEEINNLNSLVREELFSVFIKRKSIVPLNTNQPHDKTQKLIHEIESFIRLHMHSENEAERNLANRFRLIPDEIRSLELQLRYNCILAEDYEIKINEIYCRWQNK